MDLSSTSDFGELIHQAEQLTADIDDNGDLPRVERNLRQILEVGQQMWARTAQTASRDATDVKASILLGSRGFDLPRASHKLEALSVSKTFEPLEPVRDTDIQGFLKNERENAILAIIEESRKNTFDTVDRLHWESIETEWETEKQRILNTLLGSAQDTLDVALDNQAVLADAYGMKSRSTMDNVEMAYARQVFVYNESITQGSLKPSLVDEFIEVATKLDDKNVVDLWHMVKYMCDVPVSIGNALVLGSAVMQSAFVNQARKYLEDSYRKYMCTTIKDNLQEATLGGIPGVYHLVQSFLNVRLSTFPQTLEDIYLDGNPIWPIIYYCIRCGDFSAAIYAANAAGQPLAEFTPFLTEYAQSSDRRLNSTSENKIRMMYRRSVQTVSDAYKRAVFCVIGCCDVNDDHSDIADKVDDYLWLKLNQLRIEDGREGAQQDYLTLTQLQTKLLEEYGESHFNALQNPFLYFQVLFLTAQFEVAIEFLSRAEHLQSHAVHVAIALLEQNMLSLPDSYHSPLLTKISTDKAPKHRLNFARLIMIYTRKFQETDPREALQYFYFLRELKGVKDENLFMRCVSELVLETREIEMLLGRLEPDGCRTPGLIDAFHGDTQRVIEIVAVDSEEKGMFEDAAVLFDLANKHEKVLAVMNKLLSQDVSHLSQPQSRRDRLRTKAFEIGLRYKTHGHTATKETAGTFFILLDLINFFDQYHLNNYQEALDIIQRLNLIPFRSEEIEERVNTFRLHSDEIRKNFPDTLLATMNILYKQCKKARTAAGLPSFGELNGSEKNEEYITYLRKQARCLITFAGMIPYRMPGDTNARLVQLEVLMN